MCPIGQVELPKDLIWYQEGTQLERIRSKSNLIKVLIGRPVVDNCQNSKLIRDNATQGMTTIYNMHSL